MHLICFVVLTNIWIKEACWSLYACWTSSTVDCGGCLVIFIIVDIAVRFGSAASRRLEFNLKQPIGKHARCIMFDAINAVRLEAPQKGTVVFILLQRLWFPVCVIMRSESLSHFSYGGASEAPVRYSQNGRCYRWKTTDHWKSKQHLINSWPVIAFDNRWNNGRPMWTSCKISENINQCCNCIRSFCICFFCCQPLTVNSSWGEPQA
jgi:hypothetical protein